MQYLTLALSAVAAAASVGTLVIMAKTAKDLRDTKDRVQADVETFKAKTDRNIKRMKNTLNELEL